MHWTQSGFAGTIAAFQEPRRSDTGPGPPHQSQGDNLVTLVHYIVLATIILVFALLEIRSRKHEHFHATADDTKLELFMFLALLAVSQPFIFAVTGKLSELAMPDQ